MTDLTKIDDRCKFLLKDNCLRLETPVRIADVYMNKELEVGCLWDTGAEFSVITKKLVEYLGIDSYNAGKVSGIGGNTEAGICLAVAFPGNTDWYTKVFPAVVGDTNRGVDFIVGMDIITMGDLSLTHTKEGIIMEYVFGSKWFANRRRDTINKGNMKLRDVLGRLRARYSLAIEEKERKGDV